MTKVHQAQLSNINSPLDGTEKLAHQRESNQTPDCLSGVMTSVPSIFARIFLLLTGLVLLRWLFRILASILGYRSLVTLKLTRSTLELQGIRKLVGLSLGKYRQIIPLSTIKRIDLEGYSGSWALGVGVTAIILTAALSTILFLWGIIGQQRSWVIGGIVLISIGGFIDLVAFYWVRRRLARSRASVDLITPKKCYRIHKVSLTDADRFMDQLAAQDVPGWQRKPIKENNA
jgi:hypothetical protein